MFDVLQADRHGWLWPNDVSLFDKVLGILMIADGSNSLLP